MSRSIRFDAITDEPRGYSRAARLSPGIHLRFLTWLIAGVIAGLVASAAVGGFRQSLLGDVVVGAAGGLGGGWLFNALQIELPIGALPGNIIFALIGAGLLLLLFRLLRPGRRFA